VQKIILRIATIHLFSPHYFKEVKISSLALLKMVMHARSGGRLEVMGLILGKIDGPTMIVMDVFALPVEGTETRVNAQHEVYEYMTNYIVLFGSLEKATWTSDRAPATLALIISSL